MKIKKLKKSGVSTASLQSGIIKVQAWKNFNPIGVEEVWNATTGTLLGKKGSSLKPLKSSISDSGELSLDIQASDVKASNTDEIVVLYGFPGRGDKEDQLSAIAADMATNAQVNNQTLELGEGGALFIGMAVGDYNKSFKGNFFCVVALSDNVNFNPIGTTVSEGSVPPDNLTLQNGHTLYLPFTAIKLDSGKVAAYYKGSRSVDEVTIGSLRS